MILSKFDQVAYIDRVEHPRYHTNEALVSCNAIKRLKTDHIKLVFPGVNETSEWSGGWYISRKIAMKCKKFNNNGLKCYVIPKDKMERLIINEQDLKEIW